MENMIYLYIIVQEFTKFNKTIFNKNFITHTYIYIKIYYILLFMCTIKIYRIYLCSIFIDRHKSYLDRSIERLMVMTAF